VNLFLNFNGAFALAVALPAVLPLAAVRRGKSGRSLQQLLYLAPLYIWVCFYSSLPHKEERFLCPCYPLLCLAAATALLAIGQISAILLEACGTSSPGRSSHLNAPYYILYRESLMK
jgi:hypothetical protein